MRLAALVVLATVAASVAASSGPLPEIRSGLWEIKIWYGEVSGMVDPLEIELDPNQPSQVGQRCLTPELVVQDYQAMLATTDPACETTVEEHTSRGLSVIQTCTNKASGVTFENAVAHVAKYRWETMIIEVGGVSTDGMWPVTTRGNVQGRYLGECPAERRGFLGLPKG